MELVNAGGATGLLASGMIVLFFRMGRVEKRIHEKLDNGLRGELQEVKEEVIALSTKCDERSKQYEAMGERLDTGGYRPEEERRGEGEYCDACRPRGNGR